MIFNISYYKKLRNLYLLLKMVQNAKRVYLISFIENNEGISVGEIVDFLNEPQAIVSQKLAQLRKANLVISKKEKTKIFYKVNQETIAYIIEKSNYLIGKRPQSNKLKENFSEISQSYNSLKIILNNTRWNILDILHRKGKMSQKQLLELFQIKQPFMAQNLGSLVAQEYLIEEKRGRDKFYKINKEKLKDIQAAIKD